MNTNSRAVLVPAPAAPGATNAALAKDIRDIRGPVEIPSGWAWLGWTLALLAVAVAAFLVARFWRRTCGRRAAARIIVPPHVRARNRLNAALQLLHDPRPFCFAVSDALRVYLEERFEYRAPERTTDEFLDELAESPLLARDQKLSLADFLSRCDLVKFAKLEPAEIELRDLHDRALRLVEETAPSAIAGQSDPPAPPLVPRPSSLP